MELIFWWMPILWTVVVALAVTIAILLRRRKSASLREARPIAHSDRLTTLPEYRAAVARYAWLLVALSGVSVVLLVAGVTLAARPATKSVVYPELNNRDIVLCLDVSGSMTAYDAAIVEVFGDLAQQFDGERISLVVFNASAVTYFPLTSDYDYIAEQFATLIEQFESDDPSYFDGTFFGDGSSLIGDGLASCAQRFDAPGDDRSRSIILATDNLLVGDPIFTLEEAGRLAAGKGIRVYGINPGDKISKDYLIELAEQFERVVADTDGAYYAIDDPDAVPSIVDSISAEQAAEIRGAPQLLQTDQPAVPVILAFIGLAGLLVLAWRLRR